MARLIFDEVGKRFYETGVDRCVLYLQDKTGDYPLGVAWNGITEIQQNPSGAESNKQYADNIDYLNLISKETFGGSIASFTQPDEWALCDGSVEPVAGIRMGQQTRRSFGLSYRTLIGNDIEGSDYGYKIHLIYNAKATPSERSYSTMNDSPEALNPSWTIDTTPVNVPGYKPTSHIEIDSTKVDADKLAAFEDIILGSETSDPRLPSPAEVIAFFQEEPTPVNPLTALTVAPEEASKTVLGKEVSTLQTGVTIANGVISGTLPHISDFTGFSGDPELQSGNYLVLSIADIAAAATSVKGGIVPSAIGMDLVEMINDPDRNIVLRVTSTSQVATFVQSDNDGHTLTQEFSCSGLTLEPAG